jgi:predicted ATPase
MKDKIRKDFHVHLKKVKLNPDKYPTRDHYPFNLDLFQKTRSITLNTPVTFFVGENGSGKSTLDEPETALSPKSQLELLELLKEAGRSIESTRLLRPCEVTISPTTAYGSNTCIF